MITKKPPVTRASLPPSIQNLAHYLGQVPGVTEVRRCDLTRTADYHNGLGKSVQHYDPASRTLRVKARSGRNVAFISLRINPRCREAIEGAVLSYRG